MAGHRASPSSRRSSQTHSSYLAPTLLLEPLPGRATPRAPPRELWMLACRISRSWSSAEHAVVVLLFPFLVVDKAFGGGSTIPTPAHRRSVQQRLGRRRSTANLVSGKGPRLPWSELAAPDLSGARPGGLAPPELSQVELAVPPMVEIVAAPDLAWPGELHRAWPELSLVELVRPLEPGTSRSLEETTQLLYFFCWAEKWALHPRQRVYYIPWHVSSYRWVSPVSFPVNAIYCELQTTEKCCDFLRLKYKIVVFYIKAEMSWFYSNNSLFYETPRVAAGTYTIKLCVWLEFNFGLNKKKTNGQNILV
jgi:hypothetical protein